jgi:nitrogen fixation protein NifU and related proteins
MADLRDLYQEVILEHSRTPRNYRQLAGANRKAEGFNPLCGDHFTVYLNVEGDSIRDIAFQGSGCAISKASASMMTQSLKGKSTADAEKLFDEFHKLVTGAAKKTGDGKDLGKLTVFSGVCEYPARVKCATLAWHALHAALQGGQSTVSTE